MRRDRGWFGWSTACSPQRMASRLITCPETAHLELIDYETSPFGMLIRTCSGQVSVCEDAETCPRTCAARFDRRDRDSDRSSFILEVTSLLRRAGSQGAQ